MITQAIQFEHFCHRDKYCDNKPRVQSLFFLSIGMITMIMITPTIMNMPAFGTSLSIVTMTITK